jgi:hypothetical protein
MSIQKTVQFLCALAGVLHGAAAEIAPVVCPPYYMVHYKGSTNEGELKLPVTYTLWLPPDVKILRGVIVHQHGCGVSPNGDGAAAAYRVSSSEAGSAEYRGSLIKMPTAGRRIESRSCRIC